MNSIGKIKNLRVRLVDGPGMGNKATFTFMLNGDPTALAVTLKDKETDASDTIHEVDVAEKEFTAAVGIHLSSTSAGE